MTIVIFVFFLGYFSGSIPFGLLLSILLKKKDPRNLGSKNIGATNIARINGWKLGLLTLILDILKSFIPVKICYIFYPDYLSLISISVFLGHLFPFWLKFKGGKGIAVLIGILFGLSYLYGTFYLLSWLLIAYIFKYSSLAAIISSISIYLFTLIQEDINYSWLILFFNVFIFFKHKENIRRLFNKTESKIKFKK
ncbi:MAG: acyl-phosphate glycerol 3-phosphate acyltransferase [Rickettsiales bacterium]|jgi:glycerol-3-phosphate acyltransferase PlsY|nr:acyl-phosphate glycerol 3-phosphate acyltransferase [Rickettsiales bacterium]OUW70298.1 MAG: acyl-phosphate glycerol 3-phosphate acyltransferase [Rickettsiales bacterium TMED211]